MPLFDPASLEVLREFAKVPLELVLVIVGSQLIWKMIVLWKGSPAPAVAESIPRIPCPNHDALMKRVEEAERSQRTDHDAGVVHTATLDSIGSRLGRIEQDLRESFDKIADVKETVDSIKGMLSQKGVQERG